MIAVRQYTFGGPEQLRLEEVPDPHPAPGQVRIRVASAGVHLLDALIRRGAGGPRLAPTLPMTPGREVAGVVDEVGAGVEDGLLGRFVVADLGTASGGYAQLAVAPREALHEVPDGMDADQAVAMVGTGRTAMAILELAAPTESDLVLVTAAAGGIGTLLVQAARAGGAAVIGVAGGPDKVDLVRRVGAHTAIDHTTPGWPQAVTAATGGRPVTLALDGVGGDTGRQALELVGVGGRLVMFGTASGSLIELSAGDLFARGISAASAIGARILQRPGGVRPLETAALQAAATGRLTPIIGRRFSLAQAGQAHTAIESRTTTGKTVLHPGQGGRPNWPTKVLPVLVETRPPPLTS
jgi:NADPH2:quinone reductase